MAEKFGKSIYRPLVCAIYIRRTRVRSVSAHLLYASRNKYSYFLSFSLAFLLGSFYWVLLFFVPPFLIYRFVFLIFLKSDIFEILNFHILSF
jgi:hypothetical protein